MPYEITIGDRNGNAAGLINGVTVPGPAIGVTGVTFNPDGAVLDKIGTCTFKVPLTTMRNNALVDGATVTLRNRELGIDECHARVIDRTITGTAAGMMGQITCEAMLGELRQPTVTSGFATAQGEPFLLTLTRIMAAQTATPWFTISDMTDGTLDGVAFTAGGISVASCLGKLATERPGAHFKYSGNSGVVFVPRLGVNVPQRVLSFGRFGTDAGLTITTPPPNTNRAVQSVPTHRFILDGGITVQRTLAVVNSLVPVGAGNGIAQLTLRPLYNFTGEIALGNGAFQSGPGFGNGYDASHPVRRRPRLDGGGTDGFEYYIQDDASVGQYGEWWNGQSFAGIAPVTGLAGTVTPTDLRNASLSLYIAALAHLGLNAQPHDAYTIKTEAHGDLRDVAGKTVRLIYRGFAQEKIGGGQSAHFIALDLNKSFVVMEVLREEDDTGAQTDTWTLSSNPNGKTATSDTGIQIAALQQLQYTAFTAQTYPAFPLLPFDDYIDVSHPITRTFPGNNATVQVLEVSIAVFTGPARVAATSLPHAHASPLPAIPHDIGNAGTAVGHDVGTLPHDVAALSNVQYRIGGQNVGNGQVDYNPGTTISLSPNPPGGAVALMYDPVGNFLYYAGTSHGGKSVATISEDLSILQINPTAGGTGGTVKATTGGKGGTVQETTTATHPDGAGTTRPIAGHNTGTAAAPNTNAIPGSGDAAAVGLGLMDNGNILPGTVTVAVNGVPVGTVTGGGRVDATGAWIANGGGTTDIQVQFTVAPGNGNPQGLGRVYGLIQSRTVVTTLKAHI